MELLNIIQSQAFRLWSTQAIVVFFFISGLTLLAIGVGLIVNSRGSLRFFGGMNRWVSMRRATKPLETLRDTRQAVKSYRYWLAAIFVTGGAFALFGLFTQYDARAIIFVFGLDFLRPDFAVWLIDSVRWMLIVGNLIGIVVGIMLAFFPAALIALEARGSHWYSERQMTKGSDRLNLKLDDLVTAYPRNAGWIIVVFALGLIGAFGFMLAGLW